VDVCEAALHIDLKEAAQIVYDAVWADPSDPSKTYINAADRSARVNYANAAEFPACSGRSIPWRTEFGGRAS
jgi:hypothetical protein